MSYLAFKYFHLLSMVLLFGAGLGSAFYKWMADREGNIQHIAITNRHVVFADWIITTPTIIFQPISGWIMLSMTGLSISTPWVSFSLLLYFFMGLCWLPVVWLQIRMRDISRISVVSGEQLPRQYWRYASMWFYLGVPAFIAMLCIVFLMVFKPIIEV